MYRENLCDVMEKTGEKISIIIVPKNKGLKGYAWQVLKDAGVDLEQAERIESDKLLLNGVTYVMRRGEDIPGSVVRRAEKGEVVLGVTGDDLYDEFRLRNPGSPLKVENTYDWHDEAAKFFRPTLCLVNKTGKAEDIPLEGRIALNEKYRETSRLYLAKSPKVREKSLRVQMYTGDIECNVPDEADCAIDTVYSGGTLQEKGLDIVEKIRFSDLAVISPLYREESDIGRAVRREFEQIRARLANPADSYTSRLLQDDRKAMRKLNEEALELVMAYCGAEGKFIPELADVVYAATLLAVKKGVTAGDLAKEMLSRQKGR